MNYLIIKGGKIDNIIVAEPEVAAELGAVPSFEGARIGDPYPPIPSPVVLREAAYDTDKCIPWQGAEITVTEAARLWTYYTSEGDGATATVLTEEIARAKGSIRRRFPDGEPGERETIVKMNNGNNWKRGGGDCVVILAICTRSLLLRRVLRGGGRHEVYA